MGRKPGALDLPRNRMILDLRKKGMSYNKICKELEKSGFSITVQRVAQIIKKGIVS
tara:strand:+ start:1396 stop:1563 length:168 start_codon:yes stop_codon:yes gene_type:complete